jgi:hypothetical protein
MQNEICSVLQQKGREKKPHRPNHTKADGVKRKGREHYGSDMLSFVFMQTKCQHNGHTRFKSIPRTERTVELVVGFWCSQVFYPKSRILLWSISELHYVGNESVDAHL